MKKLIIILLLPFTITCKKVTKSNIENKKNITKIVSERTSFQLFLDKIPSVSLPLKYDSINKLFLIEQTEWDDGIFTFKINLNELNQDLTIYETNNFDFESLKKSKKYLISEYVKNNEDKSLEDFASELYLQNNDLESNVFFGIPILKFKFNNIFVIGYLTVVAYENDVSFAAVRLHTYTSKGNIIVSQDRKVRDGLSLVYSFSTEEGAVNVFSNIDENGVVLRRRVFVSDEKSVKETTYIINEKGFVIKK